jgi:LysR family nitrogen assimilation transcriptional regulator
MSLNFKTLRSFITAVDACSLSAAALKLDIAQPALSHQIASLEKHFQQRLLIRSNAGVTPTAAGHELYRHASVILQQLEQAERDVAGRGDALSGTVCVGLATYSTTSILSTPLLTAVREKYPDIQLFINDNFGLVLSEMVMAGRMDMALIYAPQEIKGVRLEPLLVEELFLIAPPGTALAAGCDDGIGLSELAGMSLLLPGRTHFLRRLIDSALTRAQVKPRIVAEIESAATLCQAIDAGLGATVLPRALVASFPGERRPEVRRMVGPMLEATVSLCVSDHLALTPAALAVKQELRQVVADLVRSGKVAGVHLPDGAAG